MKKAINIRVLLPLMLVISSVLLQNAQAQTTEQFGEPVYTKTFVYHESKKDSISSPLLTEGQRYILSAVPINKSATTDDCLKFLRQNDAVLIGNQAFQLLPEISFTGDTGTVFALSFENHTAEEYVGRLVPFLALNNGNKIFSGTSEVSSSWTSYGFKPFLVYLKKK